MSKVIKVIIVDVDSLNALNIFLKGKRLVTLKLLKMLMAIIAVMQSFTGSGTKSARKFCVIGIAKRTLN